MKRMKFLPGLCGALIVLMVSCTTEDILRSDGKIEGVRMVVDDFEFDAKSRTSFTIGSTGVDYNWTEGDQIGVFPDQGSGNQVRFEMLGSSTSSSATFSGNGWALKPSEKYMAYYPLISNMELNKTAVPVDYSNQNLVLADVSKPVSDLKTYDFLAASAVTPVEGNATFQFQHLGCWVQLNMKAPKGGKLNSVAIKVTSKSEELVSANKFTKEGTVNLTEETIKITPNKEKMYSTLSLLPAKDTTLTAGQDLSCYFMIAPTDLLTPTVSEKLTVDVVINDTITCGTIKPVNMLANSAYKLDVIFPTPDPVEWVLMDDGKYWATRNVGAKDANEAGTYFAWGEIAKKAEYDSLSCSTMVHIEDISGRPQYDAATANWGDGARIPTKSDFENLIAAPMKDGRVTWDNSGLTIINAKGESIFIPAKGKADGADVIMDNPALVWTATPLEVGEGSETTYIKAYCLIRGEHGPDLTAEKRYYGVNIRPVRDTPPPTTPTE